MRFALFVVALLGSLVITLLGSTPNASAYLQAKSSTSAIVRCDVGAYVIDRDPQGLNVRSGPGKSFDVIGNLPFRDYTGVGVHITGSSGDWVQIDLGVEEGAEEEKTFFKGVGWVYAPLLGVSGIAVDKGGAPLYRDVSTKGRMIARVPGGEDVIVRGCRGRWLYVEHEKVSGWAAPHTLCANPLTTCG